MLVTEESAKAPPGASEAAEACPSEVRRARPVRLIALQTSREPGRTRLVAAAVLANAAVIIAVSAYLRPDPRGLGTHQQLGLHACGFVQSTGLPCPTCGMTTAFAYMAHGQPVAAILAQPLGMLAAVGVYVAALGAIVSLVTARRWQVDWVRLKPIRLVIVAMVLLMGSWAFKLAWGLATGLLPVR